RMASLDAPRIGYRIVIVALRSLFARRNRRFIARQQRHARKTAVNHVEQQRVTGFWLAVNAGLMRKFQADAIFTDPAHGAFDFATLAQDQVDALPKLRPEAAAYHGAAARQVDELDLMLFAVKASARYLFDQPMAIVVTMVGAASFAARHFDGANIVLGCAATLF